MLQKLKTAFKKLLNSKKVPVVTLGIASLLILTAGLFTPMTQPTTASKKKLPIYCVDTQGKKQVSISFDAAWGAGRWGRKLLVILVSLKNNNIHNNMVSHQNNRVYPHLGENNQMQQIGHLLDRICHPMCNRPLAIYY